jgi:hypothetical protein
MDEERSSNFLTNFRQLASDHDNEFTTIDATMVRAHQHSAGAQEMARKQSADRVAD